jgi:hypothetical protein
LGAAVQEGLQPRIRGTAIVKSRYQATISEDTEGWKRHSVCSSELQSVEISNGAVIMRNYQVVLQWSINPITNPKPRSESHTSA